LIKACFYTEGVIAYKQDKMRGRKTSTDAHSPELKMK